MKNRLLKVFTVVLTILPMVLLISCEKNLPVEEESNTVQKTVPNSPLKVASPEIQGRNLAANCFQCHGTNGHAGELKIAGQGSDGIVNDLNQMKLQPVGDNIMNVHARAYTAEEIKLIADFISKQ